MVFKHSGQPLRLALLALALTTLHPAKAQVRGPVSSSAPSFSLDTPTSYANTPFTPGVEHIYAGWGNLIKKLNKKGIGIVLDYTSESAIALNGGNAGDAGYAHQIGVEVDLDWEKLIGWKGFVTHAVAVNRAGHNMAADFGDHSLNGFQEIYGGGGNVGVHLVYVYGTQDLLGGRVQLALGKMAVNTDFSASPLYCTFMNKSICGNPKSTTRGDAGFATYPGSTYGGRIRIWPLHGVYFQAGAYGVNPVLNTNQYDRTGFNFSTNHYTGTYFPFEFGLIPSFTRNNLVGHYKIGIAYDNSDYTDEVRDDNGLIAALTGKKLRTDRGKTQIWVEADQMLVRNGYTPLQGLYVMAGYVHNDPHNSPYQNQWYAGLVDRGFFHARPEDTFGVMITQTTVSPDLATTQAAQYAHGHKLSGNATQPQTNIIAIEATYNIRVAAGLAVQPDYQHIIRPNLQKNLPSIDALGLKLHAVF